MTNLANTSDTSKYTAPEKNSNNSKEVKVNNMHVNMNDNVINGHISWDDVVDLGLPSGTLWMKHNIGATCKDTPKTWYGDYYAWGEITTKERYEERGYKRKLSKYGEASDKNVLDPEDDVVHVKMGGDWHMPTIEQITELCENTNNKWVQNYQGVSELNGQLFTSKVNGNTLFIPAAGHRLLTWHYDVGIVCNLWSSSFDPAEVNIAFFLDIHHDEVDSSSFCYRYYGFPVRGVI